MNADKMNPQETFANNYRPENFIKLPAYRPSPKRFASYCEWRQTNPQGTHADYREAQG